MTARPWHLIPAALRESAIQNMVFDADDCAACSCSPECECRARWEMFAAAAQALRDAAPYPDETLACLSYGGTPVELVEVAISPSVMVHIPGSGRYYPMHVDGLMPLTPGAAEALEWIKEGCR